MPFKSEAQRKKFQAMLAEGKISQAVFDHWDAATPSTKLPERKAPSRNRKVSLTNIRGEEKSFTKKRFGQ